MEECRIVSTPRGIQLSLSHINLRRHQSQAPLCLDASFGNMFFCWLLRLASLFVRGASLICMFQYAFRRGFEVR